MHAGSIPARTSIATEVFAAVHACNAGRARVPVANGARLDGKNRAREKVRNTRDVTGLALSNRQ